MRVDRPELEQFQALLLRHPAVRKRALVSWNDSLEEIEPGKYNFLREGRWGLEPGAESFHAVPPARIKVTLANPLLDAARNALREGAIPYHTLLARLDPPDSSELDQLVDLGVLLLMPPWPGHEVRLEQRIAQVLRTLPADSALEATTAALEELLTLEDGFALALHPESSIAGLSESFSRLLGSVLYLAGHSGPPPTQAHFFEEVLLEPSGTSDEDSGIFQIASLTVQEILDSAGLVARFAGFFNLRHDVLHTLAAWWREYAPSRREIPFPEMARGFAPVWKQFFRFHLTANDDALNTFDPLRSPSLAGLREMRETLFTHAQELLGTSTARDCLPVRQFAELVEALPQRYAPMLGPCVFVQPVDVAGRSWVLNRLHEGTGRYLSRVTPVLEGLRQQRLLDHLIARSVVKVEGEEADLLEVKYPWGHTVRAHPPQAARVLDVRGLHLDLPRERKISLSELTVQANLDSETFRLIDSSGRRLLPVNLSTLSDAGHPNLLRLLLTFGPGETRGVFPLAHAEGDDDFRSFNRLTCGNLVLRRRRWMIDVERLRRDLDSLTDFPVYETLHQWRCRLALPATGFYYERVRHGYPGNIKPQYIDFSSPSLCRLFVSSLRKMATPLLTLEEALPSPSDFPYDSLMERRGFELLIDSLAIRAAGGNSSPGVQDHDREILSLRKE
ncbi:MAG TPA: lantibiotic dehydratase [Thermoanaerobaculia bacterium]|nr:lantibiotic dehydratase [Thermoanaerobaculia bacterium]